MNVTTLPAFSAQIHDPQDVYAKKVAGKRTVYFDHNVWIELRDAKTDDARELLKLCYDELAAARVAFPLDFASINEAIEIADQPTRVAHADLLDSISQGLTFRAKPLLLKLEARRVYNWLFTDEDSTSSASEVFTMVPGHLGDGTMEFPAGWTLEKAALFLNQLAARSELHTVRFIAEQRNWLDDHLAMRKNYVREMEDNRKRRQAEPRGPKQAALSVALHRERIELLKMYVNPQCRALLLADHGVEGAKAALENLAARKGPATKRRIKDMFHRMPIMDQQARLYALDAVETARKPREQDFYDFIHGTVPPLYADAFVSLDGRLLRLVKEAGRSTAQLCGNLREAIKLLRREPT